MAMEVELPDPASIWKELGEFQSVVDIYVKQQTDLADRLRKTHLEFCQDQKGKLDVLDGQKKKALHDIDVLEDDKRHEAEELDRMRKKSVTLQREVSDLPAKLDHHKAKDEEQQQRAHKMRLVLSKRERAQQMEVQERKAELEAYQKALGLTIRKDSAGDLHFMFTHVDDNDLEAQFSFVIRTVNEPQQTVSLVSCVPQLETAQSFIDCYNRSQSPGRLSTLVRIFRREFKAWLVASGRS